MKTLKKLKLNVINELLLEQKQMNTLKGGLRVCSCSCYSSNGSSELANRNANYNLGDYGGHSTQGCNQHYVYEHVYGPPSLYDCAACTA